MFYFWTLASLITLTIMVLSWLSAISECGQDQVKDLDKPK